MCRVRGKTNDNDVMLCRKVAELIRGVRVMSIQNEETVAIACVPSSGCRLENPRTSHLLPSS